MSTIALNWSTLERIKNLRLGSPKFGVYLWGFKIAEEFIPYYLGIAVDMEYRLTQHVTSLIAGQYSIYHKDSLRSFHTFKNGTVDQKFAQGIVYSPDWPKGYWKFLEHRHDLQPHIDFMVDQMVYSFSEIKEPDFKMEHLKEIEKICISKIGKERLVNTRGGVSDKFQVTHSGDKDVVAVFGL